MTTTDRRQGLRTGQGLKAPCVVASTAALTLSGTQTVDGISVGSGERVLVKDQSDAKDNGIYDSAAAAWSRSKDFDGEGDAIPGTAVYVDRGTAGGAKFYAVNSSATSTAVVITHFNSTDVDEKIWSLIQVSLSGVSAFSQNTLFPLATAAAWRSSDGLSAAPDPFGSTSVSASAIVAAGIASSAVTTAKIADNAVTLAKISTGTAGTIIAHSSTGQLAEVAVGSSGNFLQSQGAGIPPIMAQVFPLLHVREEQTSGTAGGGFTSGSYQTRTLNIVVTNEITGASLSSNQIILPAGIYLIQATAPALEVDDHKAKLRNVTDGSDVIIGASSRSAAADSVVTHAPVTGRFTLAAQKTLELQHQCQTTKATNGFGEACSFGDTEVYAEVLIWKVG